MKIFSVMIAITLCLTVHAAQAQTPAQDAGAIKADKQAIADAEAVVQADNSALTKDQQTNKGAAAVQADADKLNSDTQYLKDLNAKLESDRQTLAADRKKFDGTLGEDNDQ